MIKRIAVVVLAALMSVAGARGQDPDARDRFLEQLYNFNREKAKTEARLAGVAEAQPPGFDLDRDARERRLRREEHVRQSQEDFAREQAKMKKLVDQFNADKARDELKYDQDRIKLRDEVLALGRDVEVLRGEIATLEATLAARREHLIEAVVKHRFALAKIEAMPWRRPKADKPTP